MESKLKKQFPMGVRIGFSLKHCCKLTHTRSYYLAGPGWVVSVSGSPNRINKGFTVTQASLVAQWLKKKSPVSAEDTCLIPGVGKIPWRWKWQPTPVFLPGKVPGTEKP